jgi:sugar-specific transcriptional regulator TrmB
MEKDEAIMDKKSVSSIIVHFESLGVTAQEAKVYIDLLKNSGRSGYNLSKSSGIPSSKIYMLINRLIERGFIVAADTRPVKYHPVPPEELIAKFKTDLAIKLEDLESGLNGIGQSNSNALIAWNIVGRSDMIIRAKEMIRNAKNHCFLAIWPKELRSLQKEIEKAFDRGVSVRILSYGKTRFQKGEVFFHAPSDYQSRDYGKRRLVLTVDSAISLVANLSDDETDTGIWTDNQGIVHLFRDFIIHEIYISKIEKAYPEEIRKLVGQDWEHFRIPVQKK